MTQFWRTDLSRNPLVGVGVQGSVGNLEKGLLSDKKGDLESDVISHLPILGLLDRADAGCDA